MADSVNMSLDEIIKNNKQFRVSRSRGRGGGGGVRGRGGGRGGGGRGGGGGGRGGGGRGAVTRGQSRSRTPGSQQGRSRSRSRSRGPRGRQQQQAQSIRGRSQSRGRSRSRQRGSFSRNRSASRSRSQIRGLTPKGRAGLEEQHNEIPALFQNRRNNRGGFQRGLRRAYSNSNLRSNVHSRLGVTTRSGTAYNAKPLAVAKRGISKRGRGLNTNKFSAIGLRSDQILKEKRQNLLLQNNIIKSQTFTRSRRNSTNTAASQLTVSVANNFALKRRNSFSNAGYLNKQSLAQLNNQFGGYNRGRRGPGSVKSVGSNKSNRSSRSNQSNKSRSRGRGRGGNRGIGRKFYNKQMLNPTLQKEIAAIQGKPFGGEPTEAPSGVNLTLTPATTEQTFHLRFGRT